MSCGWTKSMGCSGAVKLVGLMLSSNFIAFMLCVHAIRRQKWDSVFVQKPNCFFFAKVKKNPNFKFKGGVFHWKSISSKSRIRKKWMPLKKEKIFPRWLQKFSSEKEKSSIELERFQRIMKLSFVRGCDFSIRVVQSFLFWRWHGDIFGLIRWFLEAKQDWADAFTVCTPIQEQKVRLAF